MKKGNVFYLVICAALLLPLAAVLEPASGAQSLAPASSFGPRLKFDSIVHDFGKVQAGDTLGHSFWFTNTGDQLLIINNVHPSCGCTAAADWTRQVEPGKSGQIPIQFNSANFSGPLTKVITVLSNDTNQPSVYLQIKANVWKPVEVIPGYAVITIPPDTSKGTATVRVLNHQTEPLFLGTPEVTNTHFAVEVRTNMPGREYQLVISASDRVKPGSAQASIQIPTSATNLPPLSVVAYANVQPALSILPAQLNLPAGPLPHKMSPVVTIINNTTNQLTLSEPSISAPGVDLQFREVQPGKYYTVAVTFPAGFEVTNPAEAALKLKSSNPKYPEIRVPIVQLPALTGPGAAAPSARVPPLAVPQRRALPGLQGSATAPQ